MVNRIVPAPPPISCRSAPTVREAPLASKTQDMTTASIASRQVLTGEPQPGQDAPGAVRLEGDHKAVRAGSDQVVAVTALC